MTAREHIRALVADAAVLVEFSDVPAGITLSEYLTRENMRARLERARGRKLRRLAIHLGLIGGQL